MLVLALIGFIGGLITGISPCILPVLPVIFLAGGTPGRASSRSRPYVVILGLVLSFSLVTLLGSLLLSLLHLPQDVLRWAGLVLLVLIGIGLIVPRVEELLEKPFSRIPQRAVGTDRGGFVLGLALGTVYVPCAGPVLAAITVAGSTGRIGPETVALTVSFAIGAGLPLLAFALAGHRVAERVRAFRRHQRAVRIVGGGVIIALAIGLVFDLPAVLQRAVPDYTAQLQGALGGSQTVQQKLDLGGLVNDQNRELSKCSNNAAQLESCGTAPQLTGLSDWFNTPGDAPIDLASLRGKVVLVDFWAYSCINCQRSVPHVEAWYRSYRADGLVVIGIHSPEYAFEKVPSNVREGAAQLGITYPVALDNDLATWTNYRNRYWPAHYLIDAKGVVRNVQLGEGDYANTEAMIRRLLTQADSSVTLPHSTEVRDTTPAAGSLTPETYLSAGKVQNYGGSGGYRAGTRSYALPETQPADSFALAGTWKVDYQAATPVAQGGPASVRLRYTARRVETVLGGAGTVTVRDGTRIRVLHVSGIPRSYLAATRDRLGSGTLQISVSPGVSVYSFTFG